MFYIDTIQKDRRDVLFLHILPTFIVFIAFMAVTLFSWNSSRTDITTEQHRIADQFLQENGATIRDRMSSYENILQTGSSIINFSPHLTREEWRSYVETLDIDTRYPGVQGIGFTQVLTENEKQSHENKIRESGIVDYKIEPEGKRDLYTSIVFIEPFNERNAGVLGYDMYSDPVRKSAMEQASTTGKVSITDKDVLKQDQNQEVQSAGFIMYTPTQKNVLTESATDAGLRGFVYAPFRVQDFIKWNVTEPMNGLAFEIVHIVQDNQVILYSSANSENIKTANDSVIRQSKIDIAGASWEIRAYASPLAVADSVRTRPIITILSGVIFSSIIAGFIYLLIANRTRALSEKEQAGVQEAKDELLALASHQLRTPATGVKQYIGMLRDGFAGKLNETQHMLVDKAYESNERQLSTINEMLFVARADAGHLKMDNDSFDYIALAKEVIEELEPMIRKRKQTLSINTPKEGITTIGDRAYLRMAIENILSNASKYTPELGDIRVSIKIHDDVIALSVKDTGVGVAAKDRPLLFQKFSRIPNELTNRVSGSGIGLYLTKRIVDAHNGRIIFCSKKGDGSEVTILIPINRVVSSKSTHRETFLHRPNRSTSQD
ncbi:MAG TPA: CHASE domain-containing protein [Candidatus Saccharibacteria bacterium]|jgi:signal transduction histidine kinase|nr:CHASE domain-containing protein [Candidatus Saccharibacteria bacterium]HMT55310.1 CHASE domain-containing protein [Candidatus Saccharibacteria bacterium]